MMLRIPCPKCGAELKLPDRSMLGRTGKCPKCAHRFTLTEPEEIELELASPAAEEPVQVAAARRVGKAPVPENGVESAGFPNIVESSASETGGVSTQGLHLRRKRSRRTEIIVGGVIALVAAGVLWAAVDIARNSPPPRKPGDREPPR